MGFSRDCPFIQKTNYVIQRIHTTDRYVSSDRPLLNPQLQEWWAGTDLSHSILLLYVRLSC